MSTATLDPVLRRFRAALDEIYGDRIERVVLYGSRARGDAHDESDYDVAVFLHSFDTLWIEAGRIAPIVTDIAAESGQVIDFLPYPARAYLNMTPFMRNVRHDGRDL